MDGRLSSCCHRTRRRPPSIDTSRLAPRLAGALSVHASPFEPPGGVADISPPLARSLAGRLNSKLETRGIPPMTSLATDLSDGVRLIQVSTGVLPSFPSVSLKGCSKTSYGEIG